MRYRDDGNRKKPCPEHTNVHTINPWPNRIETADEPTLRWDPSKAKSNARKHGVRFADAAEVFEDEMALSREDPDAIGERRYVITGRDARGHVLTLVYTHRGTGLRLISARRASRNERAAYLAIQ